jgi:hypothetical protein
MNEPQVRERLRQAFGESKYPAYLSSRIQDELRNTSPAVHRRAFGRRHQNPWPVDVRRGASLLAALLVVLLIAALVIGVQVWRNGGVFPRPVPAETAPSMTVKAYQAMVSADEQQFLNANNFTCTSFVDATCLPNVALADAATLQWLDDLNRNQPPARFVALNAVMRHHLALVLSDDTAFVAAFKAAIANGKGKAASAAIVAEMAVLERMAGDVAASSRGTVAAYSADVLFQSTGLLGCSACLAPVIQNLGSCQVDQASSCIADIATARLKLEAFIEDLVKVSAPDSLVQKDANLQLDLVTAYAALDAMQTAVSAGDQVGFLAGLAALGQELARVSADATSITGSH